MLSIGFRIFCWYRGFCFRSESDLLLFLFSDIDTYLLDILIHVHLYDLIQSTDTNGAEIFIIKPCHMTTAE